MTTNASARLLYDPTRILVAADDIHALAMTLRLRE